MRQRPTRLRLLVERLEARNLAAADLSHNFLSAKDVNDDGRVSASDAILVINKLIHRSDEAVIDAHQATPIHHYLDVNDDSIVSPVDALLIIDAINQELPQIAFVQYVNHTSAQVRSDGLAAAQLDFIDSDGRQMLSVKLRDAAPLTAYDVSINDKSLGQVFTDDNGRARIVFGMNIETNSQGLPLPSDLPEFNSETVLRIGELITGKLMNLSADHRVSTASVGATTFVSGTLSLSIGLSIVGPSLSSPVQNPLQNPVQNLNAPALKITRVLGIEDDGTGHVQLNAEVNGLGTSSILFKNVLYGDGPGKYNSLAELLGDGEIQVLFL